MSDVAARRLGAAPSANPRFDRWLATHLGKSRLAQAFVRTVLAGELCAPPSHVTSDAGIGALDSLIAAGETWYVCRGGLETVVRALRQRLRDGGVRVLTGWQVGDVRPQGLRIVVGGRHQGHTGSLTVDAVVVAAPVVGKFAVCGRRPAACYHGYVSVLLRVPATVDRLLEVQVGGGVYTDGLLNYVSRDGPGVYRALIPDARALTSMGDGRVIRRCRAELAQLFPDIRAHLRSLGPTAWAVRRWRVGLPCSRRPKSHTDARGLFWAGDWTAQWPSVDGAIGSGFEAAAAVREFLTGSVR